MHVRKFPEIPKRLNHILQKEKQLLSQRAYKQKQSKSQNTARLHYEANFGWGKPYFPSVCVIPPLPSSQYEDTVKQVQMFLFLQEIID